MSFIDVDWSPDRRKLKQFSVISFFGFGIIGFIVAWRLGCFIGEAHWTPSIVLWCIGSIICVLGQIFPSFIRPVYLTLMLVALPIGFIISGVILVFLYYGLFTPIGLIMRMIGFDSMQRKLSGESYWIPRTKDSSISRYYRQY